MTVQSILDEYINQKTIPKEIASMIETDESFGIELINYFRKNRNREFAIDLLKSFILTRQEPTGVMPASTLMLACYVLGLHGQIEDSRLIWEAKNVDFDTYCGLDVQLVAFAGSKQTIEFFRKDKTAEGASAFQYLRECQKCGDFDDLDEYFSSKQLPWFV